MYLKILAVIALLAPCLAWGQTYPSPHLNNITIDGTITGGVISGANASGANVTATGGVVNTLSTWMQGLFTGWGTTLYCSNYASPQACHDALPSTGGKMMMAANTTYVMSSARLLISKPNVTIECPNWSTVFQRGRAPQEVITMTGAGDVIRDCTIDGNSSSFLTLNVADLQMTGANSLAWHIQAINGGGNIQVALNGGANSRIAYSTITGISSDNNIYGIWAISHVTVMIDHNTVSGAGIDGIGFDGEGSQVLGNHLFGNHCYTGIQGGQIVQYGTTHNQLISGNTIDAGCAVGATGSAGIEIGTGNDITVSDNTIYNQSNNGVIVDPAVVGALISGNTIANSGQSGSGQYGIAVYAGASHVKIGNNRIIDNQGSPTQVNGVYVFAGAGDYIYVTENDFYGVPTPITYLASGTHFAISNNAGSGLSTAVSGTSDNRARNPCAAIDQNKEGGTYGQVGGNTQGPDGYMITTSSSAFSTARSSALSAPGCSTSLHLIQVNQRSAGATDFYTVMQSIMGSDVQDFNWGTPLAKPMVVDFCIKASVSGTFSFVLRLQIAGAYYATTYSAVANTLTCQSITIPAMTTSTVTNSNAAAVNLIWDMGSGSNQLTSTTGAWTAGNSTGVVGETAFANQTAGATFDLTSVRFYPSAGDVAWVPRTNDQEMAKVRQFYQKSFAVGTAVAQNAGATGSIGITAPYAQATFGTVSLPVPFTPMRAAPTVTFYSTTAATANCYDTTRAADAGAAAATNIGTTGLTATCTLVAGDLLGDLLNVHYTLDARI